MKISVKKVKMAITALAIPALAILTLWPNQAGATSAPEIEGIYKAKCAICHGVDGSGNTATGKKLQVRDLRSPEVQKMSDGQLCEIISRGKNKMPSYEQTLGHDKIIQLVTYTRELVKK